MTILKKHLLPAVVFFGFFLLLSYKLFYSFGYHPDFARDIYDILTIIQGKLTLIGPKLSFGGIYSGPYYYYLLAPVFYLSQLNINSLLVFNVVLFLAGGIFFYWVASKTTTVPVAMLSALMIITLPFYLTVSRGPWNGSTYLPILLILLSVIHFMKLDNKWFFISCLGFFAGVIVNIHLVALPVIFIASIYLFYLLKKKREIIFFILGFILAFAPLILFEIKHDFVMTKNTILIGSYKTFVENDSIPNAVSGKEDFFENLAFLSGKLSEQLSVNILFYAAIFVFLFFRLKSKRVRFLMAGSFALTIFFTTVLRYQFGSHYLFPVSLFFVFTMAVALLDTEYKWLYAVLIIFQLLEFPTPIYNKSQRSVEAFENRVNYVLDHNLIKKGESFNVIQISKDYSTYIPVGHEYRYFFRKNGFIPKTEFEYISSDTLLIFSELENYNISDLTSWEAKQFGLENMRNYKKYRLENADLYLIGRTN